MCCRIVLILLGLSAAAAAGVESVIRRRSDNAAVSSVFGNNHLVTKVLSHLSPSEYVAFFMKDSRFNQVLADIQTFACLRSRETAIEYFWKSNQGDIDLERF